MWKRKKKRWLSEYRNPNGLKEGSTLYLQVENAEIISYKYLFTNLIILISPIHSLDPLVNWVLNLHRQTLSRERVRNPLHSSFALILLYWIVRFENEESSIFQWYLYTSHDNLLIKSNECRKTSTNCSWGRILPDPHVPSFSWFHLKNNRVLLF